jgi:hypothetical protein
MNAGLLRCARNDISRHAGLVPAIHVLPSYFVIARSDSDEAIQGPLA